MFLASLIWRRLNARRSLGIRKILTTAAVAGACLAASPTRGAAPREEVEAALGRLREAPAYSWTVTGAVGNRKLKGATEKDGCTLITLVSPAKDENRTTAFYSFKNVIETSDGWLTPSEYAAYARKIRARGGAAGGPIVSDDARLPTTIARRWLERAGELTSKGGVISGDLAAEKSIGGREPPQIQERVSFWIKEGVLVKFERTITVQPLPRAGFIVPPRTNTFEITLAPTRPLEIPDQARRALGLLPPTTFTAPSEAEIARLRAAIEKLGALKSCAWTSARWNEAGASVNVIWSATDGMLARPLQPTGRWTRCFSRGSKMLYETGGAWLTAAEAHEHVSLHTPAGAPAERLPSMAPPPWTDLAERLSLAHTVRKGADGRWVVLLSGDAARPSPLSRPAGSGYLKQAMEISLWLQGGVVEKLHLDQMQLRLERGAEWTLGYSYLVELTDFDAAEIRLPEAALAKLD